VHRPVVITAEKTAADTKSTQKDDSDGMSYLDDEVTVTVTKALVLRPLLEDRGRITESIRILVTVSW